MAHTTTTNNLWTSGCLALALACGCHAASPGGGGASSETHFLSRCSGACPSGLTCICGACTKACDVQAVCSSLAAEAQCAQLDATTCNAGGVARACDVACTTHADCAVLSATHVCEGAVCRHAAISGGDASVGDGGGSQKDDAGPGVACGATTCAPGQQCCPGCEPGTGTCSTGACTGSVCPQDAGVTPCGDGVCPSNQRCCDHCTGTCVGAFSGAFCPDDNDPNHACGDAGMCAQQGESCLTAGCCAGLECCSGVPIPDGQAICYGGGAGCPISDYHVKDDFGPVDGDAVLRGVLALPLSTWRYKSEASGTTHLGPMAQDFQATFGLGRDDKHIFQLDADGVTFAAIQSMARKLEAVVTAQQALANENAALRQELERLREAQGSAAER